MKGETSFTLSKDSNQYDIILRTKRKDVNGWNKKVEVGVVYNAELGMYLVNSIKR